MILIADSGSSTTEWRLLDGENIYQFHCIGLNPHIVDDKIIKGAINYLEIPFASVTKLHFYGAGCGSSEKAEFMLSVLKSIFINADIIVASDLLAAARSLLQNNQGIIGILGTGSNIAQYSENSVRPLTISTGYLLADEGSGNALGKRLLKAYFANKLDDELMLKIGQDKSVILNQLYSHTFPNRYLASFAKMIFRNRTHPQIAQLIKATFNEWIEVCLLPNHVKEISLCGSIAYYFNSELQRCCDRFGISIIKVLEKPIAALTLYHKDNH